MADPNLVQGKNTAGAAGKGLPFALGGLGGLGEKLFGSGGISQMSFENFIEALGPLGGFLQKFMSMLGISLDAKTAAKPETKSHSDPDPKKDASPATGTEKEKKPEPAAAAQPAPVAPDMGLAPAAVLEQGLTHERNSLRLSLSLRPDMDKFAGPAGSSHRFTVLSPSGTGLIEMGTVSAKTIMEKLGKDIEFQTIRDQQGSIMAYRIHKAGQPDGDGYYVTYDSLEAETRAAIEATKIGNTMDLNRGLAAVPVFTPTLN